MNSIELIFIGDDFYLQSGTSMSCIYTVDGHRYDWGFVQRDLRAGKSITIRPATVEELQPYIQHLNEIRRINELNRAERINH